MPSRAYPSHVIFGSVDPTAQGSESGEYAANGLRQDTVFVSGSGSSEVDRSGNTDSSTWATAGAGSTTGRASDDGPRSTQTACILEQLEKMPTGPTSSTAQGTRRRAGTREANPEVEGLGDLRSLVQEACQEMNLNSDGRGFSAANKLGAYPSSGAAPSMSRSFQKGGGKSEDGSRKGGAYPVSLSASREQASYGPSMMKSPSEHSNKSSGKTSQAQSGSSGRTAGSGSALHGTPLLEVAELPTKEELHESGKCSPCYYMSTRSLCKKGEDCDFCHLPHYAQVKPRPCKAKRAQCKRIADVLDTLHVSNPREFDHTVQHLVHQGGYLGMVVRSKLRGRDANNEGDDDGDGRQDGDGAGYDHQQLDDMGGYQQPYDEMGSKAASSRLSL